MSLTTVIIVVIALSTLIYLAEWVATPISHRAALLNLMQKVEMIKTKILQERKYKFEKAEFFLGTMGTTTPSCGLADIWFLNLPEKSAFYMKKGSMTCYLNADDAVKLLENMTNTFYNYTSLTETFGTETVDEIKNFEYGKIRYKSYFDNYKIQPQSLTTTSNYACGMHNCPPGFICSDDKVWCERIITKCDFYQAFTDHPDSIICNASEVCPAGYSPVYRCEDPLEEIVCCDNNWVARSEHYNIYFCNNTEEICADPDCTTTETVTVCKYNSDIMQPYNSGNCNNVNCGSKIISEGNLYFESYFQAPFCIGAWYESAIAGYTNLIYLQRVKPLPIKSSGEFTFVPAYDEHIEASTEKYTTKIEYTDSLVTHLSPKLYLIDEYNYAESYVSSEWFENKLQEYFFNLSTRYVPNIWINGNEVPVADWLAGLIINLGGVSALPPCALVPRTISGVTYTSYECTACWDECKSRLGAAFCNSTVAFKKRVENEFFEKTGYHLKINPKEIRVRVGLLCDPIDPGPEERILSLPIKLIFATSAGGMIINDSNCRIRPDGGTQPLADGGWKDAFVFIIGKEVTDSPCATNFIMYCKDLRNGICANGTSFTCPVDSFCDKNSNACIKTNCPELWN